MSSKLTPPLLEVNSEAAPIPLVAVQEALSTCLGQANTAYQSLNQTEKYNIINSQTSLPYVKKHLINTTKSTTVIDGALILLKEFNKTMEVIGNLTTAGAALKAATRVRELEHASQSSKVNLPIISSNSPGPR